MRWTKEREIVRDICVQRSRAGFLTARLLKLRDDCADPTMDLATIAGDTEETRVLLRQVVQQYTHALVELGEPRNVVLRLVDELGLEAERDEASATSGTLDELRLELTRWAAQAMTAD
jgi:hypothetical protein